MENNKEVNKALADGEKINHLVQSDGWGLVKKKLIDEVMGLNDILTITEKDPQKLIMEIGARQIAIKTLLDWLRDVEGDAMKYKNNSEIFRKHVEEEYVIIDNRE